MSSKRLGQLCFVCCVTAIVRQGSPQCLFWCAPVAPRVIRRVPRTVKVCLEGAQTGLAVIRNQHKSIKRVRELVSKDVLLVLQRSRRNVYDNLCARLCSCCILSVVPDRIHMPPDAPAMLPDAPDVSIVVIRVICNGRPTHG